MVAFNAIYETVAIVRVAPWHRGPEAQRSLGESGPEFATSVSSKVSRRKRLPGDAAFRKPICRGSSEDTTSRPFPYCS